METEYLVVSSTRRFVRDGPIVDVDVQGEKKPYHLFLFNDLLIWTKPKKTLFHFKKYAYLQSLHITQEEYSKYTINMRW
jgi:hypothetical protein